MLNLAFLELKFFLPEILFLLFILIHLLYNTYLRLNIKNNYLVYNIELLGQLLCIIISLICLYLQPNIDLEFYQNSFKAVYEIFNLKLLFSIICLGLIIPVWRSFVVENLNFSEFFSLFFLSILALLLLLNSYNLLNIYLLIEMQALCFYILASFKRNSSFSTEAGLKYFVSGSFISGIFLLGCICIYASTGTLNLQILSALLYIDLDNNQSFLEILLSLGVFLVTVTFFFKLAIGPFHFWSPDVYDGAPMASTIIFTVLPKLVLMVLFSRWISSVAIIYIELKIIFLIAGFISIFIAIFYANKQKRFKKFLIYSSIGQMGFAVLVLYNLHYDAYVTLLMFIILYIITSLTIWGLISLVNNYILLINNLEKNKSLNALLISNFINLYKINKVWPLLFLLLLASLAGLPPLGGFFPKLLIINNLVQNNVWYFNVILMILATLIIWYYINVITIIFLEVKYKNSLKFNNKFNFFIHKLNYDELDFIWLSLGISLILGVFLFPGYFFNFCTLITYI